jgi:hypothetical protein
MRRLALVVVAAVASGALGCRRSHPPVEEVPPPAPAEAPAPDNSAANPTTNTGAATTPTGATAGANPMPPAANSRWRMPDGGTLNNDPRGPREGDVKAVLAGALPEVQACFDADKSLADGEYPITAHFFVENPGYTGAVTLTAPKAPKDAAECARAVYEKLRFAEFHGDKIELSPSFTYWKRKPSADGGAKK